MKGDAMNLPAAKKKSTTTQSIGTSPKPAFIPYVTAFKALAKRLKGTTAEEIAAWVWLENLAAYPNANELDSPPRFFYGPPRKEKDFDYVAPAMGFWFLANDIENFDPKDRYITGKELIARWRVHPGIEPAAYIAARVYESRLLDVHPIYGGTQVSHQGDQNFPPVEIGLFALSEVMRIEAEDFGGSVLSKKSAVKNKTPPVFTAALNAFMTEISKRMVEQGTALDKSEMPGTKENLREVAIKFNPQAFTKSPRTFDDYVAGSCKFKQARPKSGAVNPYIKLFPEYFK